MEAVLHRPKGVKAGTGRPARGQAKIIQVGNYGGLHHGDRCYAVAGFGTSFEDTPARFAKAIECANDRKCDVKGSPGLRPGKPER